LVNGVRYVAILLVFCLFFVVVVGVGVVISIIYMTPISKYDELM